MGHLDRVDRLCHTLSMGARQIVVSVDYRLAPEHPFPATVTRYDGTIHGFVTMAKIFPEGRNAIAQAVNFLK
ncbi:MAG: alpha/beta hydrolase fold domain-containing protein [Limnospira sp.]